MNFDKKFLADVWNANPDKVELIAEYFYDILFHENKDTEQLFKQAEMHFQKMEFKKAFDHILNRLDDEKHLTEYLRDSGIRHACYGITAEHYPKVEYSIMQSLERIFKDTWDDKAIKEWESLVKYVLDLMVEGPKKSDQK